MSSERREGDSGYLDWTILKYGWLMVFLIHGVFLYIGLHWLRQAYHMEHTSLYAPEQLRISYMLASVYFTSIAFSLILVILAVFVLEIFRGVQRLQADVQALRDRLDEAPPLDSSLDLRDADDDAGIPLEANATEVPSGSEA